MAIISSVIPRRFRDLRPAKSRDLSVVALAKTEAEREPWIGGFDGLTASRLNMLLVLS